MTEKNLQVTNHDFLIYKDSNGNVKVNVMLINKDGELDENNNVFRIWATKVLKEYKIKGVVMDDERLKNPNYIFW